MAVRSSLARVHQMQRLGMLYMRIVADGGKPAVGGTGLVSSFTPDPWWWQPHLQYRTKRTHDEESQLAHRHLGEPALHPFSLDADTFPRPHLGHINHLHGSAGGELHRLGGVHFFASAANGLWQHRQRQPQQQQRPQHPQQYGLSDGAVTPVQRRQGEEGGVSLSMRCGAAPRI